MNENHQGQAEDEAALSFHSVSYSFEMDLGRLRLERLLVQVDPIESSFDCDQYNTFGQTHQFFLPILQEDQTFLST
jgi:hypothetical protein